MFLKKKRNKSRFVISEKKHFFFWIADLWYIIFIIQERVINKWQPQRIEEEGCLVLKKIEFGGRMEVKRFYSEVFGVWNGNKFFEKVRFYENYNFIGGKDFELEEEE